MAKRCRICSTDTIFYIWSSSRYFNKRGVVSVYPSVTDFERRSLMRESYPVCFSCCEKHKLINRG